MRVSSEVRPAPDAGHSLKNLFISPTFFLIVVCVPLPLALVATVPLPIGAMYWDHYLYLDAANRIVDGQVPAVDFFAPAGGLGYYLFAGWIWLFPNGATLLIASWSLLTVTAPLMALVLIDVQRRSPATAWALLLPFLLFSLLPFNTGDFYPFPGTDGFGIYNRQISQLLYVLAAALCFTRRPIFLGVAITATMLALLFIKVTGVVSGVLLCLVAFGAGRLPFRVAVAAGVSFFAVIGLLEVSMGIVSAYAGDMLALLALNDTSLLPRLLQGASINFGIMGFATLLAIALLAARWQISADHWRALRANPGLAALSRFLDHPAFWLMGFLFAGLLFESQNTGSQAFIFLWPLVLIILIDSYAIEGVSRKFATIAALAMAAMLPPAVIIVQKAARTAVGSVNNITIENRNLRSVGAVTIRPVFYLRGQRMRASYAAHRDTYDAIAHGGELPANLLYSDFDFQTLWLETVDDAIDAIRTYETRNGVRFATIMTIDFTNPFPWLMERSAPHAITIGADPFRAVPPPDGSVGAAVEAVDLAMLPTCPPTAARWSLEEIYEPFLKKGHTRIRLTPCYDAFVRNELLAK